MCNYSLFKAFVSVIRPVRIIQWLHCIVGQLWVFVTMITKHTHIWYEYLKICNTENCDVNWDDNCLYYYSLHPYGINGTQTDTFETYTDCFGIPFQTYTIIILISNCMNTSVTTAYILHVRVSATQLIRRWLRQKRCMYVSSKDVHWEVGYIAQMEQ